MRSRRHPRALRALVLTSLAAAAAGGCSTDGSSNYFQTSSIAARPETGMSHEPHRPQQASTYSGPPVSSPPDYAQPANSPRPGSYASDDRWREPRPSYAAEPPYQPYASYQNPPPYQSQPYQASYERRWQPGPQAQARGAPITTGSLGSTKSHTVVVREGDTLYGLSNRHGVTIAELVKANRITDGKIRIGQSLIVPPRTR